MENEFNEKKYQQIVSGITKVINNSLGKAKINYWHDSRLAELYNGEGFYIANYMRAVFRPRIWSYDIHWAYGSVLRDKVFPLSNRYEDYNGKNKTELGFMLCSLTYMKKKYEGYDYTLYNNMTIGKPKEKTKFITLTNLDYEIFNDLYESDIKIHKECYFQDIGYLPFRDRIDEYYKKKQNNKEYKGAYESGFYGKMAENLIKSCEKYKEKENASEWEREQIAFIEGLKNAERRKYKMDKNQTFKLRDNRCLIPTYQTAYIRYKEWQVFKQHKDNIVYMNTDSVHFDKDIEFESSKELGHYGKEYDGVKIQYIRRSAYILLSDDYQKVIKTKVSGVINDPLLQDIKIVDKLYRGEIVKANTYQSRYNAIHDIRTLIDLKPQYFVDFEYELY